jgi:hypothetical protein
MNNEAAKNAFSAKYNRDFGKSAIAVQKLWLDCWNLATKRAIQDERERCAKACEEWRHGCDNRTMQAEGWAAAECASAIRNLT